MAPSPRLASVFALYSLAAAPILLGLTACYAPVQDFPVGSELWSRSNPEFTPSGLARFQVPKRVKVAVLDGGLDYNHPRLRGHITPFAAPPESGRAYGVGYDLLGGETDYFPHYSIYSREEVKDLSEMFQVREHGTHVAGLATLGNPEIGLLPIRVLPLPDTRSTTLSPEDLLLNPQLKTGFFIDAIQHVGKGIALACRQGAQVLNLSLGIDLTELAEEQQKTVEHSLGDGILDPIRKDCADSLLVVAAGNESREITELKYSIPVTLSEPNILGVGALRDHKRTAYYSNQGRFVDVFMRGSDLRSSVPGPEGEAAPASERLSGTSMATPLVAHLAARVLLEAPSLDPLQVRALILNTATLEELELEIVPESGLSEASKTAPFPARRLGLVANFRRAIEAARKLHQSSGEMDADTIELRSQLLTAPFEHGHSPF
jgi:serine protease